MTQTRNLSLGQALDTGTAFAMHGNHQAAMMFFRGVLVHEPDNFEAMLRLGTSLFETGNHTEALYWFWRGRKINRRHPLALTNYGLCLSQLGHWEEGVVDLERAVAVAERRPDLSNAARALIYNNLGNTLERLNRHREALPILDKGIAQDPSDPFPHYNRGIVLLRLNRHEEAIASLQRSLDLRGPAPVEGSASRLNDADAHYNLAMGHLLLGNFGEAWPHYEYRLLTSENEQPNLGLDPAFKLKVGEPLLGKTILVHCEQGIGDTIQFLRFLPMLVEQGASVLLIAHAAVRGMVNLPGMHILAPGEVVAPKSRLPFTCPYTGEALPDQPRGFDRWAALMSLPLYLGIDTQAKIPKPWRPHELRIPPTMPRRGMRVGVCWAGNFRHKNDAHRSIPLELFATLFDVPAQFVSVQQVRPGEVEEFDSIKKATPDLIAFDLEDMRDTAAILATCDLVITVDTSVAHVAATLGVPTWIFVPAYSTDWRWQLNRSDSPWYPSVTLYRQDQIGNWKTPLDRAKRDLSAMAAQRAAA